MTTVIRTGHTNAPGTWVEDQRERLERSSDRTPGHLLPEDGIGVVLGGIIGAAAALLVAVTVLLAASPVASGTATGLTVFAGIAGLVGGALIGAMLIGGRAHRARAEFQQLRDDARVEPPAHPFGPRPAPIPAGPTVFSDERRTSPR